MAKLIYAAISSLDGCGGHRGQLRLECPGPEEVHRFVNELERPIGTHLYGRRMYEVLRYWETAPTGNDGPSAEQDYAKIWQPDKIIYSKSLERVSSARTRRADFDPQAIQQLKAAATRDLLGERSHPRGSGDQGQAGRRVSSVPLPHRGRRWQCSPARQRPPGP